MFDTRLRGMGDASERGEAAQGREAERCALPTHRSESFEELIAPPPCARTAASGDVSVTLATNLRSYCRR